MNHSVNIRWNAAGKVWNVKLIDGLREVVLSKDFEYLVDAQDFIYDWCK